MKTNLLLKFFGVLLLFSGIYSCSTPKSNESTANKIDSLVTAYYNLGRFNGCLLVIEDGKTIYNKAFGVANVETGEPLTVDHRFRLASVTKQFTAMAVMILKDEGKLNFDDDIQNYLPELPYQNITVRNLLHHTSGLPDYIDLLDKYWDTAHIDSPERKVASNDDALEYLVKYRPPVEFNSGDRHSYSNTGYNLLALIVERASGMSYHDFMKTNIFEPLKMRHTFVNTPDGVLPDENRAVGFQLKDDGLTYERNDYHYQNGVFGDGGIFSTTRDMAKWDNAILGEKLVSPETWQEAIKTAILNNGVVVEYGFGWSLIPMDNGLLLAHGGDWVGFRTFNIVDLENNNAVVQLCNQPGIRRGQLAFAIYDILHGKELEMPSGN